MVSLFNAFRVFSMEWVLRQRHIALKKVEMMQEKIEDILSTLMPPMVIDEIKRPWPFRLLKSSLDSFEIALN